MTASVQSAAEAGLVSCASCRLLLQPADPVRFGHCPRCGAALSRRRNDSIQRTWALIAAAMICYVPANVLPVLTTSTLGSSESDTIIAGVVSLYKSGSWLLALIVLVASVMIPIGKLIALAYLLVSVRRRAVRSERDCMRLYRLLGIVGRWSMLDVFVDTLVVALVQFAPFMRAVPGDGVTYFMAVVVLTMLATQSFDPRLIWDAGRVRGHG